MSITRSGASKQYAMNWDQVFGKKKTAAGERGRSAGGAKKKAAPAKKKKAAAR